MRGLLLATFVVCFAATTGEAAWKAGAAKIAITPKKFMWMSGYAGRSRPADAKLTELWAKALVLEDENGNRAAMITLDLVGIDRPTALGIRNALKKNYGLKLHQTALCCSHTHTGPVVGTNLKSMYALTPAQWDHVEQYTIDLQKSVVRVVGDAFKTLAPAKISWAVGKATFAVNRRNNPERDVPALRKAGKLKGPVDHDVPVLRIADAAGKTRALLFGYACHATVLSFYQWSGDYPGFAQIEIEKAHPGAIALFWAGCGADQNPLPRRKVELAKNYGKQLAAAVNKVLAGRMKSVSGKLTTRYEEIPLRFDTLPTRKQIEKNAESKNRYEVGRAKMLLAQIERDGKLSETYPYPVQTWRIGKDVLFVILAGEVVVDFSIRFKQELAAGSVWVASYANDVMAYIPSLRVLKEGGYEGRRAMLYYGLPTAWSQAVEKHIVDTVKKQARSLGIEARKK